jgi:hypothetical protein
MLSQGERKVGDLLYHNHELLLLTRIGKWKTDKRGRMIQNTKFRVVGKINLDRQFRKAFVADSPDKGR